MQIISDFESFEALGPAWDELADHFPTPLLSHEWFSCIAEAFYEPDSLSVIVLQENGKLRAAAPLAIHKIDGVRQLEIIGAPFFSEPSGLLYSDREALHELLRSVVQTSRATRLRRLESGSEELAALSVVCKGRGVVLQGRQSAAPQLAINVTWPEFESSMSVRRRSDMRRARRLAEKKGIVKVEFVSPTPDETAAYLEETDAVESRSWKGKGTSSLKSNFRRFRTLYARKTAEKGLLRFGFLRIDGHAIASMTAIVFNNAFWVLKVEFDDAHSKSSPGILLMHDSIRYAFESDLERYEFLGDDEPWMQMWTDEVRTFQSPYIFPYSPGGAAALFAKAAVSVGHRLRPKAGRN